MRGWVLLSVLLLMAAGYRTAQPALAPRRLVWRPGAHLAHQRATEVRGWAELNVRPGWADFEGDPDVLHEESVRPRRTWRRPFP